MNIKINKNEKKDFAKFGNLSHDRDVCIRQASKKEIQTSYFANDLALKLHPNSFYVRVKDIIMETHDVKTFVLEPAEAKGTLSFPNYQAGQYITLEIPLLNFIYQRPYTISCSTTHRKNGEIQITVKQVYNGICSSYILGEVQIGDVFLAHGPFGNFVYDPIRDCNHIIALVGGSGITPIMAIAESIFDGIMDIHLTILYGAKTKNDIIFKEKLEEMAKQCEKIQVIFVLSEEKNEWLRYGFITKELIAEVMEEKNSFFVCGPTSFYQAMNSILLELNIPNKFIRHDLYVDYMKPQLTDTFQVTVLTNREEQKILCNGNETLMQAMEREGINAPKRCGVGKCGFCRSKLVSGTVFTDYEAVRKGDKQYQYIHPCASYPTSDVIIRLPF